MGVDIQGVKTRAVVQTLSPTLKTIIRRLEMAYEMHVGGMWDNLGGMWDNLWEAYGITCGRHVGKPVGGMGDNLWEVCGKTCGRHVG